MYGGRGFSHDITVTCTCGFPEHIEICRKEPPSIKEIESWWRYKHFGHGAKNTNYEHDPIAWTPELFDRIEDAGLANMFVSFLAHGIPMCQSLHASVKKPKELAFMFTRSTPAQKAAALAKAIEEVT
jgi:hypothetical protein